LPAFTADRFGARSVRSVMLLAHVGRDCRQ
jgi:hypothetical protein